MPMHEEQFTKVRDYLAEQGQQELVGHIEGIWTELNDLRKKVEPEQSDRKSAQEFQDEAKAGTLNLTTTTPAPHEQ